MMSFWNTPAVDPEPLTEEKFLAAMQKIRDQKPQPHPCSLGQHLVNPKALHTLGTYRCINCGAPVEVTVPLSEMHAKP